MAWTKPFRGPCRPCDACLAAYRTLAWLCLLAHRQLPSLPKLLRFLLKRLGVLIFSAYTIRSSTVRIPSPSPPKPPLHHQSRHACISRFAFIRLLLIDLAKRECPSEDERRYSGSRSEYPRKMIVTLLSRDRGDSIDEWYYDSDQSFRSFGIPRDSGAKIEESEENLENLIHAGESEALEFKEKVPDKLDLARAVSAFANSGGGRLLIRVTDSAEIIGCELET